METGLCAGNSPVTVEYPPPPPPPPPPHTHKGQWRAALMYSLICTWTNGWVNNWDAGDLRRHCAHCDVTIKDNTLSHSWSALILFIATGRIGCNFRSVSFKLISRINIWSDVISSDIFFHVHVTNTHWWLVNIVSGDGLVGQAPNHYLNQCWSSSMASYGFTGPHGVNQCNHARVHGKPEVYHGLWHGYTRTTITLWWRHTNIILS